MGGPSDTLGSPLAGKGPVTPTAHPAASDPHRSTCHIDMSPSPFDTDSSFSSSAAAPSPWKPVPGPGPPLPGDGPTPETP